MARDRRGSSRWLLPVLSAVLVLGAARAHAEQDLPRLPSGYVAETGAPVRWVYPTAATDEVDALKDLVPGAWAALGESLGAELAPELDVRVAVNFEQMQALAPRGARLPEYAAGVALSAQGVIFLSLTDPRSFRRPDVESVFVHELSHVALHRALAGNAVPRWFNEGVAIHHADEHSLARVRTLWDGTLRRRLLPLAELDRGFPRHHGEVDLAYAQSADIVRFLLEPAAGGGFHRLIARLRAGAPFEAAVKDAYGRSLATLEREWHGALERRFGRWPSLLVGLSTLWALAALLLIVGYVRLRREHARTLARWAKEEAAVEPVPVKAPAPEPPAQTPTEAVFDAFDARRRRDPEVPTVEHEGQNHTLH